MNLLSSILFSIVVSLCPLAGPVAAGVQGNLGEQSGGPAESASLQKKASDAQARIRANKDDRDQLMRAIKVNEVPLAREVLLRNGFTAEDLENAKIILRTGGGKKGGDEFEISVACCDPKEITIQRSLDYFTK